jgi:hypothetical protein
MGKPFKLRSGNTTAFKMMGSTSPAKHSKYNNAETANSATNKAARAHDKKFGEGHASHKEKAKGEESPVKDTNPHTGINPPHKAHSKSLSSSKKESTYDKIKDAATWLIGGPGGYITKKIYDSTKDKSKKTNITKKDTDKLDDKVDTKATQYQEEKVTDLPDLKQRENLQNLSENIEKKKKKFDIKEIKNKNTDTKDTVKPEKTFLEKIRKKYPEGTPLEE